MGRSKTFEEYLGEEPDLRRAYDSEPEARQIIDTARGLEGIVRHAGIHAAAVVIADRPLTDIVPVQLMEDRGAPGPAGERSYKVVTQYSMKPIEEIGLLKMDFLGLRNLDVIEDCLSIIEESTGQRPDMATLPLDDPKTFEMMARGESIGVFQFESEGMRDALHKVKPTEFEDLVALIALYRPGAIARSTPTRATSATRRSSPTSTSACARSPRPPTRWSSTRSSRCRSPRGSLASRARRPTTCARRSARRTARPWRRCASASSRAPRERHAGERDRGAVGDQRGRG